MPIFTEPEEPEFADGESRHRWVLNTLLAEYGELPDSSAEPPDSLNWLLSIPVDRRYDFADVECGLVFVATDGSEYSCSVWDAFGEDDDPWAVILADDYGARLLLEYSLFDEDTSEETRDSTLKRAADELPDRLLRGEFTRTGEPIPIPDWLLAIWDMDEE